MDERTQTLVKARQERNRRRRVESRRASERISQRNSTPPTTSIRIPARSTSTTTGATNIPSTGHTLEQRNSRVIGALIDAESRAAAAELRLDGIQSNVNQLRELLDQFQERAIIAGLSQLQSINTREISKKTATRSN